MYIFEFTDKEIKIYNQKKKTLIIERISENIIKDNRLYDYLKLVNILNYIINKYKIINNLFRVKVKVLVFEELSPSEIYLYKSAFKSISNIAVEVIGVYRFFDENYLFISGDKIYYGNKVLKNLKREQYVLIGNSSNFEKIREKITKRYKINILEFENSDTIIYEKV